MQNNKNPNESNFSFWNLILDVVGLRPKETLDERTAREALEEVNKKNPSRPSQFGKKWGQRWARNAQQDYIKRNKKTIGGFATLIVDEFNETARKFPISIDQDAAQWEIENPNPTPEQRKQQDDLKQVYASDWAARLEEVWKEAEAFKNISYQDLVELEAKFYPQSTFDIGSWRPGGYTAQKEPNKDNTY